MAGRRRGTRIGPTHVRLRVPAPCLDRESRVPGPLAGIVRDEDQWQRLQTADDHELLRSGAALSLSIPIQDHAPVAFSIDYRPAEFVAIYDAWEAEDGEDPEAPRSNRLDVRWIDGKLFAPFSLFGKRLPTEVGINFCGSDTEELEDFARWTAKGSCQLLDNPFLLAHVAAHIPHQDLLDVAGLVRGLYRGATPAQEMVRSAAQDFAIVGGLVHRRVYDPVHGFTTREGGAMMLSLPLIEDEDGLRRFRHDDHANAEAFFAVTNPRRTDGADLARIGKVTEVDPAYRSSRDDARQAALDAGRKMLAATSMFVGFDEAMPPRLLKEWYRLRDAVDAFDLDRAGDSAALFEGADRFADVCAHPSEGMGEWHEVPKLAKGIVARTRRLASRRREYLPKPVRGPTS